jgi:Flp pilus assembly protein TadD
LRLPFSGSLADAEEAYARVVTSQPEFFAARVRLGRVRTLRGDNEGAVRTLAAIPDSAPPVLVYLARLFEGDALERQGRVEEARQRYDAAVRSHPHPQSAQLALAYLQYQNGERVEAASRVRETVADQGAGEEGDPWFWYSMGLGGIVRPELSALRALVRQ